MWIERQETSLPAPSPRCNLEIQSRTSLAQLLSPLRRVELPRLSTARRDENPSPPAPSVSRLPILLLALELPRAL